MPSFLHADMRERASVQTSENLLMFGKLSFIVKMKDRSLYVRNCEHIWEVSDVWKIAIHSQHETTSHYGFRWAHTRKKVDPPPNFFFTYIFMFPNKFGIGLEWFPRKKVIRTKILGHFYEIWQVKNGKNINQIFYTLVFKENYLVVYQNDRYKIAFHLI